MTFASLSRSGGLLAIIAVLASGLVALAQPAAAQTTSSTLIGASSWSFTDSRDVHATLGEDGDARAPVGAWRDDQGKHHLSKAYVTFDLSRFADVRILGATAFTPEKSANDCDKPRASELWVVRPETAPTWASQPAELTLLDGPHARDCVWPSVGWRADEAVHDARAAGQDSIIFALRITEEFEGDLAYGRHYGTGFSLRVRYNTPPDVPIDLQVNHHSCADEPFWAGHAPDLRATVSDEEGGRVAARFELWPVDQPDARTEHLATSVPSGSTTRWSVPATLLDHDRTYAWRVRAEDDHDVSDWSEPCRFTTDFESPVAPVVSSADYPSTGQHGGPGIPGEFTVDPNGSDDVVGYYYGSFEPTTFVDADSLGDSVTFSHAPRSSGRNVLAVQSVDRAGRRSSITHYWFWVAKTEPAITAPNEGRVGLPMDITFTPRMDGVSSYVYRVDGGQETTVPAGEDGTAEISLTADTKGTLDLAAWSITADGTRSGTSQRSILIRDAPLVSSEEYPDWWSGQESGGGPGVTGTFRFRSGVPGVVEFQYYFGSDPAGAQIVTAEGDGTAEISYTPESSGFHELRVFARTADGVATDTERYEFRVSGDDDWWD